MYSNRFAASSFLPSLTPVTKYLLWANGVAYLVLTVDRTAHDVVVGGWMDFYFSLIPAAVTGEFQLWRLATYMFLHGSPFHFIFNMLVLWMFGPECERVLGRGRFLKYYAVTGVGAGLCQVGVAALAPSMAGVPVMGASGAIYGLLLAYAVFFPDRLLLLFFVIPVKAKYLVWGVAGLELLLSMGDLRDGVAHMAHFGGILFGWWMLKRRTWKADLRYGILRLKGLWYRRKFKVYTNRNPKTPDDRWKFH